MNVTKTLIKNQKGSSILDYNELCDANNLNIYKIANGSDNSLSKYPSSSDWRILKFFSKNKNKTVSNGTKTEISLDKNRNMNIFYINNYNNFQVISSPSKDKDETCNNRKTLRFFDEDEKSEKLKLLEIKNEMKKGLSAPHARKSDKKMYWNKDIVANDFKNENNEIPINNIQKSLADINALATAPEECKNNKTANSSIFY